MDMMEEANPAQFLGELCELEMIEATKAFGEAAKTVRGKKNVIRIWDLMRLHDRASPKMKALLPRPWNELGEATFCSREPYEFFVSFLMDHYLIESGSKKGEHLKYGIAKMYLQSALNQASIRFRAHVSFYSTCHSIYVSIPPANGHLRSLFRNYGWSLGMKFYRN